MIRSIWIYFDVVYENGCFSFSLSLQSWNMQMIWIRWTHRSWYRFIIEILKASSKYPNCGLPRIYMFKDRQYCVRFPFFFCSCQYQVNTTYIDPHVPIGNRKNKKKLLEWLKQARKVNGKRFKQILKYAISKSELGKVSSDHLF